MNYQQLRKEARSAILSDEAAAVVIESAKESADKSEAAMLGFACGMLAVKHFTEGVICNDEE